MTKNKAILLACAAALTLAGAYFPDFAPVFDAAVKALSALSL